MLEKQDLQAIKELIDCSVTAAVTATEERMTARIDASENRIMAYIENAVMPNFKLLAEGHQTLLETLAPKSRVDNLEDDVIFLKSIVKSLMQEVSDLKKAQ